MSLTDELRLLAKTPCEFCGKPKALHEGPCEAEENYWQGYMLGWNLDKERDDA